MADFSKMTIIGRLGKDPELRFSPAGRAYCKFTVAVNKRPRGGSGPENQQQQRQPDDTMWFNITAFGTLAERCDQMLAKGRMVYVEGRFETRFWENQQGQKVTALDVVANEVQMLDRPRVAGESSEEVAVGAGGFDEQSADDLPF